MSDYLDPAELYDLTGKRQPSKQAEILKARGFRFTRDAHGHVKLLRAHRDRKLGASDAPAVERVEPDFQHVA